MHLDIDMNLSCLSSFSRLAKYYTKVMERIVDRGDSFVTTELERLGRMLGEYTHSSPVLLSVTIHHNAMSKDLPRISSAQN